MITVEQIKELRERTNVSIAICKKALEEADGNMEEAIKVLKVEGAKIADKKSDRELKAGMISSYIHATKQVGVLLEVRTETDFVAKNEDFQKIVYDIAMHIAASNPTNIDDLFQQQYIKNPELTVGELIKQSIQKFGENMEISNFTRYSIS